MSTEIEWTDETWNPVTGCTKVSPGCDHCYAERITNRFGGPRAFDTVVLHPDRLDKPLHWRKPRRVFVNSMSDLFHDNVSDEFIAKVFDVMAAASHHQFQVLTKRPGRMASLLGRANFPEHLGDYSLKRHLAARHGQWTNFGDPSRAALHAFEHRGLEGLPESVERAAASDHRLEDWDPEPWPLPNVWLGTSVEDQRWADIRIPKLLETPAAVRFLSCEPLLGPLDLSAYLERMEFERDDGHAAIYRWSLRWVIVGGESGPGARPMHPDWARSLRDQCVEAGVPFLFKQWGGRTPKAGGRELDGRTWDEYPRELVSA